jgi:hypothetical protein
MRRLPERVVRGDGAPDCRLTSGEWLEAVCKRNPRKEGERQRSAHGTYCKDGIAGFDVLWQGRKWRLAGEGGLPRGKIPLADQKEGDGSILNPAGESNMEIPAELPRSKIKDSPMTVPVTTKHENSHMGGAT